MCGLPFAEDLSAAAFAEAAVEAARDLGYAAMRLDTLGGMTEAISLYRSLGFRPIDAYYSNPIPNTTYFELALR